jgi:hypothetical protein
VGTTASIPTLFKAASRRRKPRSADCICAKTLFPPEHGGTCKCPTDPPYLTDWSEVCGGCFTDLVIDTIFGAEFTLHQGIKTTPGLDDFV